MILLIRAMGNTVVPFCGGATGRDPRRVPPDFKSGAVTFVSAIVRSVDSTVFCVSAWVFILSLMIVWRCLPRRSHRQRSTGIGGEAWQRVKRDRAVLASTLEKKSPS